MGLFIIAEIGINHNGDVGLAKQLIDMAKECGCDAVKFQKRNIDVVYTPELLAAPRQSPWGTTQRDQKAGLEFDKEQYDEIDAYCKQKDIHWFASAWDLDSQQFLRQYNCPYNKVASAMLTYRPLLDMIASEGKHTFISTGMSTWEQVDEAVELFRKANCAFTLLHCIATYPCQDEVCNIRMITNLKQRYNCPVGYSGHDVGLLPSIVAVTLGAEAIERHITLDRAMYGSDQSASLEKRGVQLLVRECRAVESILGDGQKRVLSSEEDTASKLRYFREP